MLTGISTALSAPHHSLLEPSAVAVGGRRVAPARPPGVGDVDQKGTQKRAVTQRPSTQALVGPAEAVAGGRKVAPTFAEAAPMTADR